VKEGQKLKAISNFNFDEADIGVNDLTDCCFSKGITLKKKN
jgi:hypothetical protein